MTSTLVVVPCGSSKVWDRDPGAGPTHARDAYTGGPFKMNRRYAEHFGDEWVILSAKYGFLRPTDIIPGPYNVSFKRQRIGAVGVDILRSQISQQHLDRFSRAVVLGGAEYRAIVDAAFSGTSVVLEFPFAGLPIGRMLQATKLAIESSQ